MESLMDPTKEMLGDSESISAPLNVSPYSTVINSLDGNRIAGPSHGATLQDAIREAQDGIDWGNSQGWTGLKYISVDVVQNGQVVATVWNMNTLAVLGISIGSVAGIIAAVWYMWK